MGSFQAPAQIIAGAPDMVRDSAGPRIEGLDIARGIAAFVMLVINFKCVLTIGDVNPGLISGLIDFLERRAAVVLVMVSGIGLSLMTTCFSDDGRVMERPGARKILISRAVFLLICGALLIFIWSGDILHFYAIFIFAGAYLASKSTRYLLFVSTAIWLISFVQFSEYFNSLQTIIFYWPVAEVVSDLFLTGYYPFFPWAAVFIFGMCLGRWNFRDRKPVILLLTAGIGVCVSVELVSFIFSNMATAVGQAPGQYNQTNEALLLLLCDLTTVNLSVPTPFSVISGIGTGTSLVMAGILLSSSPVTIVKRYLLIGGRSTLTLYIGHILFFELLDRLVGVLYLPKTWLVIPGAFVFFAGYVKLMSLWLKKYQNGPVELLMRLFSQRLERLRRRRSPVVNPA